MKGIQSNIQKFQQAGVSSNQIGVVVIFDGIQFINDGVNKATKEVNPDDNVMDIFNQFDLKYGKIEGRTMEE